MYRQSAHHQSEGVVDDGTCQWHHRGSQTTRSHAAQQRQRRGPIRCRLHYPNQALPHGADRHLMLARWHTHHTAARVATRRRFAGWCPKRLTRTGATGARRGVTATIERKLKRRDAVEPVIGHMKSDGGLARNFLKGVEGDAINALLGTTCARSSRSCGFFAPNGASRCGSS